MKEIRRIRILCAALAAMLIWAALPLSAAAEESGRSLSPERVAQLRALEKYSEKSYPSMDVDPGLIDPGNGMQKAGGLPASYDLRPEGRVTSVKHQGDFGTCWAYAALGSAESILISRGKADQSIDLSEKHLAYFTYNYVPDKLNNTAGDRIEIYTDNYLDFGGNIDYSTTSLASWKGAIDEKLVPGFELDPEDITQRDQSFDDHYAYDCDNYHMTDCLWVAPYDTDALKRYIIEYGAPHAPVYYSSKYLNYDTNAYYYDFGKLQPNHQILIVGWDDSYSASNFKYPRPSSNGAWLCRNTWGTEWGDEGYFWMSYEDFSFTEENDNVISFDVLEPVGNDYNIYQYDGGSNFTYIFFSADNRKTAYSAAVFNAAESDEILKQVGIYTSQANIGYTVQIYTGVGYDRPNSGRPMLTVPIEGTFREAGYHTVYLPEMVPLTAGERFSVIVKLATGDDRIIQLPVDMNKEYKDSKLISVSNPGETFYSLDGKQWTDADVYDYVMRIKAVTAKFSDDELSYLKVNGGQAEGYALRGKYFASQSIRLKADDGDPDHVRFSHWEVSPSDVTIENIYQPETSLRMPARDTEVSAVFSKINYTAEITRLSGEDRYSTSAAISSAGWDSANTVIFASGANYPDALAASPLAAMYHAPVLLCGGEKLSESVYSEILRLMPANAIIIGGSSAVSAGIEQQIRGMIPTVERIAGTDRSHTAALIARRLNNQRECFIVSGRNYPDALSVSAVAAAKGCPILYFNPDGSVPAETAGFLSYVSAKEAVIVGGTAAVGARAEGNLAGMGIAARRISGDDRYSTSLMVCASYSDILDKHSLMLATGANYPDALAGAAFAARISMPVLLISPDKLWEAGNYITAYDLSSVYVAGGRSAVPSEVLYGLFEK